jgi:hypothetical protein
MTLVWFIVWLISNLIGSHEPLRFDPVNVWTATLLLAIALDLARAHTARPARREHCK